MKSKILNSLPELIENNIISLETASDIRVYYNKKVETNPSRLFIIFGVLGATLIGLGIILILAHNWDAFSKTIKTILAFFPLVVSQLLVGYTIFKKKTIVWKETTGVLLFFAVGACIALISQIYNIPGNLSRFLLTWIVLCLPLIYLLKSKALTLLSIVFATYYAGETGYSFGEINRSPWFYILILFSILPFYYKQLKFNKSSNSVSIFNWIIPLSLIIVLGAFIEDDWVLGFLMYMMLFGALYNIGKQSIFNELSLRKNGFLVLGSLGSLVLLIILSFKSLWKHFSDETLNYLSQEMYMSIALLTLSICLLICFLRRNKYSLNIFQYKSILFVVIFFIGLQQEVIGAILINVMVFVVGLLTIKNGSDRFSFRQLNSGLIIISILIICRFFDTDMSFILRGILFLIVGASFFLANYYMLRKQKPLSTNSLKKQL